MERDGAGQNAFGELTLEEARRRFVEQRMIFGHVLFAAYAVDAAVSGTTPPSNSAYRGAVIFTKALAHSIALDKVAPALDRKKQIHDVSSCAVLLRAIAESYISFRYCAIEPQSDNDLKFRLALIEFHRRAKQFKIMKRFGIADKRIADAASMMNDAKIALESDEIFQAQSEVVRKKQLDGSISAHRSLEEIAEASGINPNFWGSTYAFLSQFSHASPMAVTYVANFRADLPIGP